MEKNVEEMTPSKGRELKWDRAITTSNLPRKNMFWDDNIIHAIAKIIEDYEFPR